MNGILTHREITALVVQGAVRPRRPLQPVQFQPTTLDLRLGEEAWALRAGFLPARAAGATVAERVGSLALERLDLREGALLRRGHVYLVRLLEDLALPPSLRARANPRSSTGRIDVFTRTVVDGHDRFDEVPEGYSGPVWLEVAPRSFDVRVATGLRLNQLRFVAGRALLADDELLRRVQADGLLLEGSVPQVEDASLLLGLSLRPDRPGAPVGWRALAGALPLDLTAFARDPVAAARHPAAGWFEPLHAGDDGTLVLQPEEFYLLASLERLGLPPDLAAEMLPYDVGMGELRTNYAGFFDPGFGWTGRGARAVLEVRAHDVPFRVEHGQPIFRLQFSRTVAPCQQLYGQAGAAYQDQGLALARYFAPTA